MLCVYWRYVGHFIYNDGEHYIYIWVIAYTCNHGALHGGITPYIYVLYVNQKCFRHIILYIIMGNAMYSGGVYIRGM